MTRITLALAVLAAVLAGGLYWSITAHAETRAERDALERRVETLETVKGLRNEASNTSDDDLANSISDVQ